MHLLERFPSSLNIWVFWVSLHCRGPMIAVWVFRFQIQRSRNLLTALLDLDENSLSGTIMTTLGLLTKLGECLLNGRRSVVKFCYTHVILRLDHLRHSWSANQPIRGNDSDWAYSLDVFRWVGHETAIFCSRFLSPLPYLYFITWSSSRFESLHKSPYRLYPINHWCHDKFKWVWYMGYSYGDVLPSSFLSFHLCCAARLSLYKNHLTGTIPSTIGLLSSLGMKCTSW